MMNRVVSTQQLSKKFGKLRQSKEIQIKDINLTVNKKLFDESYHKLLENDTYLQIVYGGSSSGKSYSIARFAVVWALSGRSVLIGRKIDRTIRSSIYSEVCKAILELNLSNKFDIQTSTMTIVSKISNGCIKFIGLKDVERIKSITPPKSTTFDLGIIEEATELNKNDFLQFQLRMRGNTAYKKKIILLFNPIYENHWIYKEWFKDLNEDEQINYCDDNLLIMRTTYKDNSHLDIEEINVLEKLKFTSPYHYKVYALGEFGVLGSRIFTNWEEKQFNSDVLQLPIYQGGDFGFSNSETAFVICKYDKSNQIIYICDELYKRGLMSNELINEVKQKQQLNTSNAGISYWDNEDPRMVAVLKQGGIKATATIKPNNGKNRAIDWLQQHKIVVHPKCTNFINEISTYVWKEQNGEPINEPVKIHDHLMDSLRYALYPLWANSGKVVGGRGLY